LDYVGIRAVLRDDLGICLRNNKMDENYSPDTDDTQTDLFEEVLDSVIGCTDDDSSDEGDE